MRLQWGLPVPDDAVSAWGCRAIVDKDGLFDVVPDRVDRQGTDEILTVLNEQFPMDRLRDAVGELLKAGSMNMRQRGRFVLWKSGRLEVVADTLASGGYCYVAAWLTE